MSAQLIYDTAPLGSLISYSNGEPRPPARFTREVKAWENANGVGRLVERLPAHLGPDTGGFYLHLGNFGSAGCIVMVVRRHFSLGSTARFEIVEQPRAGMVRVLTGVGDREELRYLAQDSAEAEAWIARNRSSGIRTEVVSYDDRVVLTASTGRAA